MIGRLAKSAAVFAFVLMTGLPALAAERQRFTGEAAGFDFGIETDSGTATLYLARKPFNEPASGAAPRLVPDDEKLAAIVFEETKEAGIYQARFEQAKLPEGQLEAQVQGVKDAVDIYLVSDRPGDHAGHDHSHTVARKSPAEMLNSPSAIGGLIVALFLLGFAGGRLSGRRIPSVSTQLVQGEQLRQDLEHKRIKQSSALIFAVLGGATLWAAAERAQAGEGHAHGEVEIGSGAALGEVAISKKSQFLIGLRTKPAKREKVHERLETLGHLIPKPQLDAVVRAPVAGLVRLSSDELLGTRVVKGQLIGHVEGLGAVQLYAPIGGVVIAVSAVSGVRLDAGEPVVRIVEPSTLWVDAEVFQKDLPQIQGAEAASILLDGAAVPISGRLLSVKPMVDEKTMAAKVFVEIANPGGELPLGAQAHVSFILPSRSPEAMVFPKGAVLNRGAEKIVFVQVGPESFVAKPVVTRFGSDPSTVVVTKGLEENERVVVSGGYQLLVGAN